MLQGYTYNPNNKHIIVYFIGDSKTYCSSPYNRLHDDTRLAHRNKYFDIHHRSSENDIAANNWFQNIQEGILDINVQLIWASTWISRLSGKEL